MRKVSGDFFHKHIIKIFARFLYYKNKIEKKYILNSNWFNSPSSRAGSWFLSAGYVWYFCGYLSIVVATGCKVLPRISQEMLMLRRRDCSKHLLVPDRQHSYARSDRSTMTLVTVWYAVDYGSYMKGLDVP